MGENKFMDMDYQEFKVTMMKGRRKPHKKHHAYAENTEKIKYLNLTDLPTEVDWR